ncbi:hypothetical protein JCM10450v2_007810 [Rhodotorula kratochvilovae]
MDSSASTSTSANDASAPPAALASSTTTAVNGSAPSATAKGKKRAREPDSMLSPAPPAPAPPPSASSTRRIDSVVYAGYEIQAQYASPYPLDELPGAAPPPADKAVQAGVGRDGRVHARDAGGKFGKKVKKAEGAPPSEPGAGAQAVVKVEEGMHSPSFSAEPEASTSATRLPSPELSAPSAVSPVQAEEVKTEQDTLAFGQLPSLDATENGDALPPAPFSVGSTHTELPPPADTTLSPPFESPLPFQLPLPTQPPAAALSSAYPPYATQPPASLSVDSVAPAVPAGQPLGGPLQPAASGSSPNVRAERGRGGRFLPKPPGESVKAKRAIERASRATQPAHPAPAGETPHLTQRQQRELARKAREERERAAAREGVEKPPSEEVRLLVCEKCFKYMALPAVFAAHSKECTVTQPPGRRVYQRGATSIWEVDGAVAKLYCQNLCLFAKLFIEHKYMFFDVEGFTFYLLTETMAKQEWVLGYFSKEKVSYDDNNLACIVVFPPFRQKGWATLLIEFSYELSRRLSATPGSPERPLSDLGQKGYLAHWTAVLVRYFRAIFALRGEPPSIDTLLSAAHDSTRSPSKGAGEGGDDEHLERERRKRLRRSKGWDGELPPGAATLAASPAKAFTLRGGSARPRSGIIDPADGSFTFPTALDDLARAVNLRADDVAFALVESGLAQYRQGGAAEVKVEEGEEDGGAGEVRELELVISPELVEEVALRKGVKPMPMLDVAYVCNI